MTKKKFTLDSLRGDSGSIPTGILAALFVIASDRLAIPEVVEACPDFVNENIAAIRMGLFGLGLATLVAGFWFKNDKKVIIASVLTILLGSSLPTPSFSPREENLPTRSEPSRDSKKFDVTHTNPFGIPITPDLLNR